MRRKYWICLLALIFVLGFFGCQSGESKPETTVTVPTETTLPPPDPAAVYADARTQLENRETVTLDVTQTVTTLVGGQTLEEETEMVLSYAGWNTDEPIIQMEKTASIPSVSDALEEEDAQTEKERKYTQWYADGNVYIELADIGGFSGTADPVDDRCVPVALLDESLYGKLELTEGETTVITFAEPTAAESWAMPQGAVLVESFGEAQMDAQGVLTRMQYTLTYEYGSAVVTVQTQTVPREEAVEVALPEQTEKFTQLTDIDAIPTILRARTLAEGIDSAESSGGETIVVQAVGLMYTRDTASHIYRDEERGLLLKITETHGYRDTEDSFRTETETAYRDGKAVTTVDGGVPTSQSGLKDAFVWDKYCIETLTAGTDIVVFEWWQDVEMEDLGSLYYFTVTPSEDWSNSLQNATCMAFFDDPSFLNQYASAYETKKHEIYFSVDKYTGLIVSMGIEFEGEHIIDGEPYLMTMQMDQSINAPCAEAYTEITDEVLPQEVPENPATPLFYHVTGENGQEMWLLGTIHVGDQRMAFLPQAIYDALAASDALALEINNDSLSERVEQDSKLQKAISEAYYYSDGTQTKDHLEEELYEKAVKYLKATGNYNLNAEYMKPALWQSFMDMFILEQAHRLSSGQGMEEWLTRLAKEQEKPIREVEDVVAHIRVTTDWSEDLQALILKETLEEDHLESWESTMELYELWCQGDEQAIREYLEDDGLADMTEEERAEYEANKHLVDEYNKSMVFDRNEDMLDVAIEYLESGDVVFYAVGLAHLLDGTNGLVDTLREAGYTVELVK